MRLSAAGAMFIGFAMVATAIGVIASHALAPGLARLAGDATLATPNLPGQAAGAASNR